MNKFLCILIILTKITGIISTGQDEAGSSKGNKGKGPFEPVVQMPSSSDDESDQQTEGIPDYFAEVIAPDELENWKMAFVGIQKDERKNSSTPGRQNPNTSQHLGVEPIKMKNPASGGIHINERPMGRRMTSKLARASREPILVQTDIQNFRELVQQVTGLKVRQREQQMGLNPSMQSMPLPPSFARHQSHPPLHPNPLAQFYGHQQLPIHEIFNNQFLQNYLKSRFLEQYGRSSVAETGAQGSSHGVRQQIAPNNPLALKTIPFPSNQHSPYAFKKQQQKELANLQVQQRQLVEQAQQISTRPDVKALLESLATVEANLMGLDEEDRRLEIQLDSVYAELLPFKRNEKKLNEEKVHQLQSQEEALINQRMALTDQIAKLNEEKAQIKQQILAKMPPPPKQE